MIPLFKTLNLLQTLLFLGALAWFIFKIPNLSGDTVLIVIAVFIVWLAIIAVVGKHLFEAQRKRQQEESQKRLTVFEFIRQSQEETKQTVQ